MENYKSDPNIQNNDNPEGTSSAVPDPNRKLFLLMPIAVLVGVLIGYAIWGREAAAAKAMVEAAVAQAAAAQEAAAQGASAQGASAQGAAPASGEPQRFPVDADDDPTIGPDDAPIQIIEFADYNCGYCQKFHVETYPALMDAYPGQIQFVYRDFPILGQTSLDASVAANCAGDQDMYWEYHDLLYSGRLTLGAEAFSGYADELNLDSEQFSECVSSDVHTAEIVGDAELVASFGARGTPVFFINGIPLVGAAPIEQFIALIDSELDTP